MHPLTYYLLGLLGLLALGRYLYKRIMVAVWFIWQTPCFTLGIQLNVTPGLSRDEDDPIGCRSHYSLGIGIGIASARLSWFGKVPKDDNTRDHRTRTTTAR